MEKDVSSSNTLLLIADFLTSLLHQPHNPKTPFQWGVIDTPYTHKPLILIKLMDFYVPLFPTKAYKGTPFRVSNLSYV